MTIFAPMKKIKAENMYCVDCLLMGRFRKGSAVLFNYADDTWIALCDEHAKAEVNSRWRAEISLN